MGIRGVCGRQLGAVELRGETEGNRPKWQKPGGPICYNGDKSVSTIAIIDNANNNNNAIIIIDKSVSIFAINDNDNNNNNAIIIIDNGASIISVIDNGG